VERLHGQRFETIRQAKDKTLAWLLWYNQSRMHSTLNYVSPTQFEQQWRCCQEELTAQADSTQTKTSYGKAGKQTTLPNFPTASTTTNYNYL
jgi:putative transposase